MEDGVKGSSVSATKSKVIHKAGWLKKSSGLLGLWKDRYIQILQTQLLVCDSEDEQKGTETLDLSSYERCQDQKAFLKRKRHFTLIPTPGTKVQDVKFQAKNIEERDTWIQALNDGINRGKNKIFDEVKVDTSCSLEHVTRDRAKVVPAKRRPPTRIHLREVAEAADDDSLRLGLEALDTGGLTVVTPMPMPKHKEAEKEPVKILKPPTKSNNPQPESSLPDISENNVQAEKEPVKILMPPTKSSNMQPESSLPDISENNVQAEKEPAKILMPPTKSINMQPESSLPDISESNVQEPGPPAPPSKSLKESVYAHERLLSENEATKEENKMGLKTPNSVSRENLSDVISSPPKPPPKILSDKMKIKWVGSSSQSSEKVSSISDERGSKENLVDFGSNDLENTVSNNKGLLSNLIERKDINGSMSSLKEESQKVSDHQNDKVTVNEDIQNEETLEITDEAEEKNIPEENEMLTDDNQEVPTEKSTTFSSEENKTPGVRCKKKVNQTSIESSGLERQAKAYSMGDLLAENKRNNSDIERDHDNSIIQLRKDHLYKMEMKLACGRERTETLLNQVLKDQFRQTTEGNGLDVNQVTLLNEVMKDLQEASEVLKEIKEPKNITYTPEIVTAKEKQKELLALQRRSVPF